MTRTTSKSKEYSVKFPQEDADEIDSLIQARGTTASAVIRERYYRGTDRPAAMDDGVQAATADLAAPPSIAPDGLTTMLQNQIATLLVPVTEVIQPIQTHTHLLQSLLEQVALLQFEIEGIIALLNEMALDVVPPEDRTNRQALTDEIKAKVRQKHDVVASRR